MTNNHVANGLRGSLAVFLFLLTVSIVFPSPYGLIFRGRLKSALEYCPSGRTGSNVQRGFLPRCSLCSLV